jgi:anti-anti-sigma factor
LAEFKECCDRSAKIILVDLQEVHFIDSAGLGALVRMHTTLKSAGRRLYLCSPTQQVQLALEISNLDQIIPTLANREELLKL